MKKDPGPKHPDDDDERWAKVIMGEPDQGKTRWDGMSREEFMRPASQGGMSMGEGRVIEPEQGFQGTMFEGCPKSQNPWGKHRFVSYANLNSVEFFRCSYGCGVEFSD